MHVVDRPDREPVHQLERHRRQPGGRDPGDGFPGPFERREERQEGGARRRRRPQTQRRLGDQCERALRPDDEVGQRVARDVLDVLATGPDHAAIGHDDLEPEHGLARLAVLHTAQAAGIRAQVATDRAHLEARRIGRIEQAVLGDRGLQPCVDDARLGDHAQVRRVDLDDPVHRGERDRQGAIDAGGAAAQPRAGTARDDRDIEFATDPDERGDLGSLGRQRHGARQAGRQIGGLVASIRLAIRLVDEQPEVGKPGTDSVQERIGDGAACHARAV